MEYRLSIVIIINTLASVVPSIVLLLWYDGRSDIEFILLCQSLVLLVQAIFQQFLFNENWSELINTGSYSIIENKISAYTLISTFIFLFLFTITAYFLEVHNGYELLKLIILSVIGLHLTMRNGANQIICRGKADPIINEYSQLISTLIYVLAIFIYSKENYLIEFFVMRHIIAYLVYAINAKNYIKLKVNPKDFEFKISRKFGKSLIISSITKLVAYADRLIIVLLGVITLFFIILHFHSLA